MTNPTPLPDQQLNDRAVQILSNEGAQCGNCGDEPGDRICPDCEKYRARYITALRAAGWAPQDEGLAGEVRRLRARVAELEGPAVEARAALAALCYDLEDPGTAALGALYLISRATVGVEAPKDDAALALARHDAEVLRKAAEVLEATDRDDDAVNLLYLLADDQPASVPGL